MSDYATPMKFWRLKDPDSKVTMNRCNVNEMYRTHSNGLSKATLYYSSV